jgi:hypothetical protein
VAAFQRGQMAFDFTKCRESGSKHRRRNREIPVGVCEPKH